MFTWYSVLSTVIGNLSVITIFTRFYICQTIKSRHGMNFRSWWVKIHNYATSKNIALNYWVILDFTKWWQNWLKYNNIVASYCRRIHSIRTLWTPCYYRHFTILTPKRWQICKILLDGSESSFLASIMVLIDRHFGAITPLQPKSWPICKIVSNAPETSFSGNSRFHGVVISATFWSFCGKICFSSHYDTTDGPVKKKLSDASESSISASLTVLIFGVTVWSWTPMEIDKFLAKVIIAYFWLE